MDARAARDRGREAPGAETVAGLVREAPIEGGAGMVGLDDVRVVAHAVEDILAVLRDEGSFPPSLVPGLLRATRLMRPGGRAGAAARPCWTNWPRPGPR